MNERIRELAEQAEGTKKHVPAVWQFYDHELEKFAELIVQECVNTLEFHGFDDAVPYIRWMATNKLGVK